MNESTVLLCLVGSALLIALALLVTAIRIIPEYQRLVVFRLGRCVGARGPGIVFLIPFILFFTHDLKCQYAPREGSKIEPFHRQYSRP